MFQRLVTFISIMLIWLGFLHSILAHDTGYQVSMFDGESLTGWQIESCQSVIVDHSIITQSGKGIIRSNHVYSDFVLEFKAKAIRARQKNGIYFHGTSNLGGVWPNGYLLQLQSGEVKLLNTPIRKDLIRPHRWNHYELTVIGTIASLKINGIKAWDVSGVVPRSGFIALQVDIKNNGPCLFRELYVTELNHSSLFNGKNLSGWQGAGRPAETCWKVKEEMIVCTGEKGPWLRSEKKYDDFNLRLQYKVTPGGNSGVFIRVPENGNHHGFQAGVEIQILDDHHSRYFNQINPNQFCGSIYAVAAAQKHVSRQAGKWNTLEIECLGNQYLVHHNGMKIVDASTDQYPKLKERLLKGFLGLQNHSEKVWFRNLRVGPPMIMKCNN